MNDLAARLRSVLGPAAPPWQTTPLRRAAVLAPIVVTDAGPVVLFVVRSTALRQHAGQIAFPGGVESGDPDPAACALRETDEEIGVTPTDVEVVGSLEPRQSSSGYLVHCVVGLVAAAATPKARTGEVARLLPVPLGDLLLLDRWQERAPPPRRDGSRYPTSPHFDHRGDVVWGLTGRFAFDLVRSLTERPR